MKKVLLGLFLCLSLICLASLSGVKLHAETGLAINSGASMRTAGDHQGLKFSASVTSLAGVEEHGFYIAKGVHTKDDITTALGSLDPTIVDGDKLLKKVVDGEDLDFHLVVFNMDSLLRYSQLITVLAYTYDGSSYTYTNAVTKNLADVARAEYNANATPADLVTTVAEAAKVKITKSDSSVNYYGTLASASAAFADGDTVELVKGTYDDELTITVGSLTIYGANKDKEFTSAMDGTRTDGVEETILTNAITVQNGVSGFEINGVEFTGAKAMILKDSQSVINFEYNYCNYTGDNAIVDAKTSGDYKDIAHTSINISNNFFSGKNSSSLRDIYFQGYVANSITINNNKFKDTLSSGQANAYAIKLNYFENDTVVHICNNTFYKYCCNWVIDLGFSHSDGKNGGFFIIENNTFSESTSVALKRNGIRLSKLSDSATVIITHNRRLVFYPYYNAMLISSTSSANGNSGAPTVCLAFNLGYKKTLGSIPSGRDELTGDDLSNVRIGLGIKTTSKVYIENNYPSSCRFNTGAYDNNTSAAPVASTFVFDFSENGRNADKYQTSDSKYADFKSFEERLDEYYSQTEGLSDTVNAYYGGTGVTDITTYITEFDSSDASLIEIKNGVLIYLEGLEDHPAKLFMAKLYGIEKGITSKPLFS